MLSACLVSATLAGDACAISFKDVTASAGVSYTHGYLNPSYSDFRKFSGGGAVGDYDGDGWLDVYVVGGTSGTNRLFRNRGRGKFSEVGVGAGVALSGVASSGPVFADYDGDGRLDLFVGGVDGTHPTLFRNQGDGTFGDVTVAAGLVFLRPTFSAAFGDYDGDGDLDLATSHWNSTPLSATEHLWRNEGDGTFTDVSLAAGLVIEESPTFPTLVMTFTPRFADIDNDGDQDLLYASDFHVSQVFRNEGDGTFTDVTTAVISDENGMGSAIADYDNDGDLDWFVSSIWDPGNVTDPHVGKTGNRLYRNDGTGTFEDVTDAAGVRAGFWGWASTFADFDNDGHLDLFHVNGAGELATGPGWDFFVFDPSRLFVSNGDGTFTERSAELGIVDPQQGRGAAAFDYDRDGDLDLMTFNNQQPGRLYRNGGDRFVGFLTVRLRGFAPNVEAIGARVYATTGATTQMRELSAGSNYVSAEPAEAHFGLGAATSVDELRIVWPDGEETVLEDVPAKRRISVTRKAPGADDCNAGAAACSPGGKLTGRTECLLEMRVSPTPPPDASGAPASKVVCTEGDPACDLDPDTENAECLFEMALCINNADPRLTACVPSDVSELRVTSPRATSLLQTDRDARAALDAVIGGASGLALPKGAPLANATPDLCTAPIELHVPLKQLGSGALRPGRMKVSVKARASDRRSDPDTLTLQCLPPA